VQPGLIKASGQSQQSPAQSAGPHHSHQSSLIQQQQQLLLQQALMTAAAAAQNTNFFAALTQEQQHLLAGQQLDQFAFFQDLPKHFQVSPQSNPTRPLLQLKFINL